MFIMKNYFNLFNLEEINGNFIQGTFCILVVLHIIFYEEPITRIIVEL